MSDQDRVDDEEVEEREEDQAQYGGTQDEEDAVDQTERVNANEDDSDEDED